MSALEIVLMLLPLVSATALAIIFSLEWLARRDARERAAQELRWAGFRWKDRQ
jgi:hypothetical protein